MADLPQIVSINVTGNSFKHLEKILELGFLEDDGTDPALFPTGTDAIGTAGDLGGRHGHRRISKERKRLDALVDGLSRALCGATVTVTLTADDGTDTVNGDSRDRNQMLTIQIGKPTDVATYVGLTNMEDACIREINDINGPLDFQLVVEV
jgi:hypothetical protein